MVKLLLKDHFAYPVILSPIWAGAGTDPPLHRLVAEVMNGGNAIYGFLPHQSYKTGLQELMSVSVVLQSKAVRRSLSVHPTSPLRGGGLASSTFY